MLDARPSPSGRGLTRVSCGPVAPLSPQPCFCPGILVVGAQLGIGKQNVEAGPCWVPMGRGQGRSQGLGLWPHPTPHCWATAPCEENSRPCRSKQPLLGIPTLPDPWPLLQGSRPCESKQPLLQDPGPADPSSPAAGIPTLQIQAAPAGIQ